LAKKFNSLYWPNDATCTLSLICDDIPCAPSSLTLSLFSLLCFRFIPNFYDF
jgi:hypothetical protein